MNGGDKSEVKATLRREETEKRCKMKRRQISTDGEKVF